jgi:ABC-2 type transport system permease protein/oleandomycin transport system permease protein
MTSTVSSRPVAAAGGGLGWVYKDIVAMTWRNLRGATRVPQVLVFSIVQPIIFVFMFRYVFGGAINIPGLRYVDYLMPGIFVQTIAFGGINTAVGLAEDKGKGMLERLRSLPMAQSAVLAGRVLADTVRNILIVTIILGIGLLIGFRPHGGVGMVLVGVLVLITFGFGLAWLFAFIGLSVTNGEAAQAASFPLLAPLAFASNLFASPDTMPHWLQGWARHQPVSATADAVRACMLGGPAAHKVLISLAWSLAMAAIFGAIAIHRYRNS